MNKKNLLIFFKEKMKAQISAMDVKKNMIRFIQNIPPTINGTTKAARDLKRQMLIQTQNAF